MNNQEKQIEGYWRRKEMVAQNNMIDARINSDSVLIEIAAQHPLNSDSTPNDEYKARLDLAIKFYNKLKKESREVKLFCPGSVHMDKFGKADKISLAEGGYNYLKSHGVNSTDMFDISYNNKWTAGCYSSGDESKIAANLFFEGKFGELWTICGPYQIMRKALNTIQFGAIPKMYSVPTKNMHHSCMNEIFGNIPNTLYDDHAWQDPCGEAWINNRKSKQPGFKENFEKGLIYKRISSTPYSDQNLLPIDDTKTEK